MANYSIENDRNDYTVREDEIYSWFKTKNNAELCRYQLEPFVFVQHLETNVKRYIDYIRGHGNDGQYSIQMHNLRTLCGGAFSLHYVLLLAASNFPQKLFDHLIAQIESFLFYYIFTKSPTKELERNFSRWADDLQRIGAETNSLEQINLFNKFLRKNFQQSITRKEDELVDYLRRYSMNSMQQYRTRYLLAKFAQYVDSEYRGLKHEASIKEYTDLDVEHILPNNPASELREYFANRSPDKDYDEYKNRLGNLTLLEKPINIVAGNEFFSKKRMEFKKSKYYLTSSIPGLVVVGNNTSINRINEKLKAFEKWDADSIDERQEMLIRLVGDIWKIEEYK